MEIDDSSLYINVHRKFRPNISGSLGSSSSSRNTKSVGISVFPICTWRSSSRPTGNLVDLSAKTKKTLVDLNLVYPIRLVTEYGIRFTLKPRSQREHAKIM
ncbi:unnamed protein product [Microthlaspi erraticum]|uniref:Uncharacterized protein n=1 Tax=Microthlaspi erraticum TaxID=1685480 RepID=A0A6D2HWU0_9BRAS|nr:unnamed protein product [Microthlaspi erraticum]